MVIDEDEGEEDGEAADDVYKESLTSTDGFTRGPNGRVKFNKDTKKRRRENADNDEDVEMGEADARGGKKSKRRTDVKLGHEFKAKVRPCNTCLISNLPMSRTESWGRRQEGWCGTICLHAVVAGSQKAGTQRRRREAMSNVLVSIRVFHAFRLNVATPDLIATRWVEFRCADARGHRLSADMLSKL